MSFYILNFSPEILFIIFLIYAYLYFSPALLILSSSELELNYREKDLEKNLAPASGGKWWTECSTPLILILSSQIKEWLLTNNVPSPRISLLPWHYKSFWVWCSYLQTYNCSLFKNTFPKFHSVKPIKNIRSHRKPISVTHGLCNWLLLNRRTKCSLGFSFSGKDPFRLKEGGYLGNIKGAHQDIIIKSVSVDNCLLSESRYLGYNLKPAKI